jgi:DinB family protein
MTKSDLLAWLEFGRKRTMDLIDNLAKDPNIQVILGWQPGPGRARLGWQLMHLGATDDKHLNVRIKGGQPREPEYMRRFAGGSTPDDNVPTIEEIRRYVTERRQDILQYYRSLDESQLPLKPNDQTPWTYQEGLQVLAWHEAHHHGQAHLTVNLFKAAHPQAS